MPETIVIPSGTGFIVKNAIKETYVSSEAIEDLKNWLPTNEQADEYFKDFKNV